MHGYFIPYDVYPKVPNPYAVQYTAVKRTVFISRGRWGAYVWVYIEFKVTHVHCSAHDTLPGGPINTITKYFTRSVLIVATNSYSNAADNIISVP